MKLIQKNAVNQYNGSLKLAQTSCKPLFITVVRSQFFWIRQRWQAEIKTVWKKKLNDRYNNTKKILFTTLDKHGIYSEITVINNYGLEVKKNIFAALNEVFTNLQILLLKMRTL